MGRHEGHARCDGGGEGHQFLLRQPLRRAVKARQVDVGIDGCIAMAGEMFGAGETPSAARPRRKATPMRATFSRVGAEAAAGGDRAGGIGRQIEHGSKIEVDAGCSQLASQGACDLLDEGDVVERAEFAGDGQTVKGGGKEKRVPPPS